MISIVVPVYNAEDYLEKCLDSLLGQTYENIEVICINDGSQDESGSILGNYSKTDKRLIVISQKNRGIASARNKAMTVVRGDWVMFVDSDDWIDRETCKRAKDKAVEYGVDVVLWSYIRESENGKTAPRFLMDKDNLFDETSIRSLHRQMVGPIEEELRDPTLLHSWGTVWGKLYSRKILSGIQFVDTAIVGSAEDALFNIEVFTRVRKAFYMNELMYHYRKCGNSFTGCYNKKLNERWLNLYRMISDILQTQNLSSDFFEALKSRIVLGLIGQGLNECRAPENALKKMNALKEIVTQEHYSSAAQTLPLQYFPPHWRLFFWAAKNNMVSVLYLLLILMEKFRS